MNNKINPKRLFLILLVVLILIAILICLVVIKNNRNVLSIYSVNDYGLMMNEGSISEEIFDEYSNLTHYKYKQKLENGTYIEKKYNIKYTFDTDKRITKVEYDNNYINIEYNNENKISKLVNLVKEETLEKKYEFNFTYNNDSTEVSSSKAYDYNNGEEKYIVYENYIITEVIINNEKYSVCTISENNVEKQKYTYKTLDKKIDNSNIFSLLNIDFEGYVSLLPSIKNTNFTIEIPVFNSGNIVSFQDLSNTTFTNFSYNNYYDKNNNILRCEMLLNNDIYYMYKNVSNNSYNAYSLEINNNNYTYIEYKDYLNESGVYKREILEQKTLSEDESKKMLAIFEEYFEENKQKM